MVDKVITLSIIIPSFNEAERIGSLIADIRQKISGQYNYEIIISDGGSTDETTDTAIKQGVKVIHASQKGRAIQLNEGASAAKGQVLYFMHADTYPPLSFDQIIMESYRKGHKAGCFGLRFDHDHPVLNFSSMVSRYNIPHFQFGDQTLFVEKTLFEHVSGYRINRLIMEDVELPSRLRKYTSFIVMNKSVITSARKYIRNGIFKTESVHLLVYLMHLAGFPQTMIIRVYKRLLS